MNSRPPERLEKRLARVARQQGLNQERLRRWVSFMALCGVLERAVAEGGLGSYYMKGGAALELRFAGRARATKDLDIGLDASRENRLDMLREALHAGFDQFTFRVKAGARHMELADTVRVEVAVEYRGRSWQTIEVDLGPAKSAPVELVEPKVAGLTDLEIPVTSPVRCLSLAEQVAQKLHACTSPHSAGRARDVVDILLIDLLAGLDYRATGLAARRVFAERATHSFPPAFAMPAVWRPELEAMALDIGIPQTTWSDIERSFLRFIRSVSEAGL